MSIAIVKADCNPGYIDDGGTVDVEIVFEAFAEEDGVTVLVDFVITPYPENTFGGSDKANGSFTFSKKQSEFKRTLSVSNVLDNEDLQNGIIFLTATRSDDPFDKAGATAVFTFK